MSCQDFLSMNEQGCLFRRRSCCCSRCERLSEATYTRHAPAGLKLVACSPIHSHPPLPPPMPSLLRLTGLFGLDFGEEKEKGIYSAARSGSAGVAAGAAASPPSLVSVAAAGAASVAAGCSASEEVQRVCHHRSEGVKGVLALVNLQGYLVGVA